MKNPELLETFDEILEEYNKVYDVDFTFTDSYYDPDVVCCEESTADGYSVWLLKEASESVCVSENLYYYEPRISDILRLMHDVHDDSVEAFVEVDLSYISEWMYEALCTDFQAREKAARIELATTDNYMAQDARLTFNTKEK